MEINKAKIAELVIKIQNGDMSAFNELYKTISPHSFFIALEITKNEQDSEDILQESFISALEKINTLDKPESFVSWFNMIVANKSKDFLKKKKPSLFDEEEKQVYEMIPDDDREFSPQDNFNDAETRQMILDVVNELSDEKRMCVLLYYYEEMSVSDIARAVSANESTVKSRLFQARKDLETKFKRLENKGFSLYGASPVGVMLWALRGFSETATEKFVSSEASADILSKIASQAADIGAATASAGTAAETAATVSAATAEASATASTAAAGASTAAGASSVAASTAVTGTGIAAKIASFTVVQKVVAGIAVVGIVGGSAAGGAAVLKNAVQKEPEHTTSTTEEFNIDYSHEMSLTAVPAIAETETTIKQTLTITFPLTTISAQAKTESAGTAAVAETTEELHTQPTTKKQKQTKPSTTRRDYSLNSTKATTLTTTKAAQTTRSETTTKKPTTTQAPTEEATDPPKTTEATTKLPDPTLIMNIYEMSGEKTDVLTITVPPGTVLTHDYLVNCAISAGYLPESGINCESIDQTAQSGESYILDVYV